jgi:hypothetical protein
MIVGTRRSTFLSGSRRLSSSRRLSGSQRFSVSRRTSQAKRAVALACTCFMLLASMPAAAQADEFWGLWASEVKLRVWWEMPFVIVFSLPAMIVTTPFWAGTKAYVSLTSDDDAAGGEDDY